LFIHYDEVAAAFTSVMMGADSFIWQLKNKRSPLIITGPWLLLLPFAGQNITGHKFQPHKTLNPKPLPPFIKFKAGGCAKS